MVSGALLIYGFWKESLHSLVFILYKLDTFKRATNFFFVLNNYFSISLYFPMFCFSATWFFLSFHFYLHTFYLCRIVSSSHKSSFKWVAYSIISFIKLPCQQVRINGMKLLDWLLSAKRGFKIFKFKSFNHPSVFLQHYDSSVFGPA